MHTAPPPSESSCAAPFRRTPPRKRISAEPGDRADRKRGVEQRQIGDVALVEVAHEQREDHLERPDEEHAERDREQGDGSEHGRARDLAHSVEKLAEAAARAAPSAQSLRAAAAAAGRAHRRAEPSLADRSAAAGRRSGPRRRTSSRAPASRTGSSVITVIARIRFPTTTSESSASRDGITNAEIVPIATTKPITTGSESQPSSAPRPSTATSVAAAAYSEIKSARWSTRSATAPPNRINPKPGSCCPSIARVIASESPCRCMATIVETITPCSPNARNQVPAAATYQAYGLTLRARSRT